MIKPDVTLLIHTQATIDGEPSTIMTARIPLLDSNLNTNITTTDNGKAANEANRKQNREDKQNFEDYVYYLEEQAKEFTGLIKTYNEFMGILEPEPLPTIEPDTDTQISNENTDLTVQNKGVIKL
nr:MAG: hypothetical protein [Bacteriophage sp.]